MTASEKDMAADVCSAPEPFVLAKLYPRSTGLPTTIWASPSGRSKQVAHVRVSMRHGDPAYAPDCAIVSVGPPSRLLRGTLPASDLSAAEGWIALNTAALVDYWNGAIDSCGFAQRPKTI